MNDNNLPRRAPLPAPDLGDNAPETNQPRRPPLPPLRGSQPNEQEREAAPPQPKSKFDLSQRTEALKQMVYSESDKWPDDRLPHLVDVLLGITRGLSKNHLQHLADRDAKTRKES